MVTVLLLVKIVKHWFELSLFTILSKTKRVNNRILNLLDTIITSRLNYNPGLTVVGLTQVSR